MANAGVILVVDDQESNQQICQENLELEDFEVHLASNGQMGLETAREIRPDLILLDIMMPVMDGYQTLEKLKNDPAVEDVPVLMLTAKAGSKEVAKALSLGASDYVKKPFSVDELIARAKHLVAFKKTQDANRGCLRHMEEHQQRLIEELSLAASIQKSMLPEERLLSELQESGVAVTVFTRSAGEVNGDFCDVRRLEPDLLSLSVADCKGHGVSAGMMTMAVHALLDSLPPAYTSARESLSQLDRQLRHLALGSEFVVMGHLLYNLQDKKVIIASAGIPSPLIYRTETGKTEELSIRGLPLRLPIEGTSLEEMEVTLKAGDKLILFSDGLTEARDEAGDFFGIPNTKLIERINEQGGLPAADLSDWLIEEWERFRQDRQEDDCTLVILESLDDEGRISG